MLKKAIAQLNIRRENFRGSLKIRKNRETFLPLDFCRLRYILKASLLGSYYTSILSGFTLVLWQICQLKVPPSSFHQWYIKTAPPCLIHKMQNKDILFDLLGQYDILAT